MQRQRTIQVMVSDRHQQLYRFRSAQDALRKAWMADAEKHYLTHSFRFGPAVAHVANVILSFKGETVKLQGLGQHTLVKRSLPEGLAHRTWLHRTVSGLIENALRLEKQGGHRMFGIGGIDSYSLCELEDLFQLSRGRNDLVQQKKLFRTTVTSSSTGRSPRLLRIRRWSVRCGSSRPTSICISASSSCGAARWPASWTLLSP